jgi:hypothetical protein
MKNEKYYNYINLVNGMKKYFQNPTTGGSLQYCAVSRLVVPAV